MSSKVVAVAKNIYLMSRVGFFIVSKNTLFFFLKASENIHICFCFYTHKYECSLCDTTVLAIFISIHTKQ